MSATSLSLGFWPPLFIFYFQVPVSRQPSERLCEALDNIKLVDHSDLLAENVERGGDYLHSVVEGRSGPSQLQDPSDHQAQKRL